MRYVSNAFSLNMLSIGAKVAVKELRNRPSQETLACHKSIIGHENTALLLGLPFNRESVELCPGDILLVAQYSGPRLPEGTTKLPKGACFRWFEVTI